MTQVNGSELVARHWPTLGPHTGDSTASAAATFAELVRYLNHATIGENAMDAWPRANDAEATFSALAEGASRLPQLLQQLSNWLRWLGEDSTLRHYGDLEPWLAAYLEGDNAGELRKLPHGELAALVASVKLEQVVAQASELGRVLDQVKNLLARLGHETEPGEG